MSAKRGRLWSKGLAQDLRAQWSGHVRMTERRMSSEFTDILYEVVGHVATISINRPQKLNSVTADTVREIEAALDKADKDPVVGVIVFTGVGEKSFCAGADVSWQKEGKMGRTGPREFTPPYLIFSRCTKPIIARVNGYAIGGGNHFAYFCDFTIAADHAIFSQSEPRVAYPASGPVVNYLVRLVGHKRAREMWMLGRRYTAAQMLDWGMVNAVVPMAELDTEVQKWCTELLAVAPTCLKVYKAAFVQEFQDLLGQGDFLRRWMVPGTYSQTEQREGTSAFLEKRKPDYSVFRKPT
jgi:2-ketocyclohexanecarboxyl-CoA hydrolase